MLKKILGCLREYKKPTWITFLCMIGEAVIETFLPAITAGLINKISDISEQGGADAADKVLAAILETGGLLILLAFISLSFGFCAGFTSSKASAGLAKNIRHDIFHKIQTYSFENIDKFSSASLVTRITTDVSNVTMAFMMAIRTAIRSPLMLILSVIMTFIIGGKMALAFVIVIPVLAFGLFMISKKAMPVFHRVFKRYDLLNESIEENVRGSRVVKGFSREEHEKEKFDNAASSIRKEFTKAERIVALNNPLMSMCMYFIMLVVLYFGSYLTIKSGGKELNIPLMSSILIYGVQVLMSLMMLSMVYVMITISTESAKRICEVLDEEPGIKEPENPVREVKDGSIDFENVNFKYAAHATEHTLADINLHIDSGLTVGILGGTGSGKSALVRLIPRLYDIKEGCLKVGGVDVRKYGLRELRDNVAVVLQKNELFSGTIKDNLKWGNKNATDEQIIAACKLAQADDFVRSFPDGYDTWIEQGGTNVSGGQKQRLCIARALLKNPKVLILDDSTSAVDTKTDALIRQGFKEYLPETTKLIIAQRVSSVMDADMIIIMESGRILDKGTHEELLSRCTVYREIYEQQTNGGADNE